MKTINIKHICIQVYLKKKHQTASRAWMAPLRIVSAARRQQEKAPGFGFELRLKFRLNLRRQPESWPPYSHLGGFPVVHTFIQRRSARQRRRKWKRNRSGINIVELLVHGNKRGTQAYFTAWIAWPTAQLHVARTCYIKCGHNSSCKPDTRKEYVTSSLKRLYFLASLHILTKLIPFSWLTAVRWVHLHPHRLKDYRRQQKTRDHHTPGVVRHNACGLIYILSDDWRCHGRL